MLDVDGIRKHCLDFPHTMEMLQWKANLVFKVDGKMFAVASLEVGPVRGSFKCTPENFLELCERPRIIPVPYMARAQWVALETLNAVSESELCDLLMPSYQRVWERLAKKRRAALSGTRTSKTKTAGIASKAKKSAKKAKKPIRGRRK